MTMWIDVQGQTFRVDVDQGIDLAVPERFDGRGPDAFGLPHAVQENLLAVSRGDAVNCARLTLVPHGNGTHTEGVGHLLSNGEPVAATPVAPRLCIVVTVGLSTRQQEDGVGGAEPVLAGQTLIAALKNADPENGIDAVVVRVAGLSRDLTATRWSGTAPPALPFTTAEALRARDVQHLLVEVPSLDREDDPALPAHRAFFGLVDGQRLDAKHRTVTEMVAVPKDTKDGIYLLDLGLPALYTDAVPSRPVLYPLVARGEVS